MSPLQQAQQWVEDHEPGKDEIQESIDNLCHLYAQPACGQTHEDIHAAIRFLMDLVGGNLSELVLPEKLCVSAVDLGDLGSGLALNELSPGISSEARRALFESLKAKLQAPF